MITHPSLRRCNAAGLPVWSVAIIGYILGRTASPNAVREIPMLYSGNIQVTVLFHLSASAPVSRTPPSPLSRPAGQQVPLFELPDHVMLCTLYGIREMPMLSRSLQTSEKAVLFQSSALYSAPFPWSFRYAGKIFTYSQFRHSFKSSLRAMVPAAVHHGAPALILLFFRQACQTVLVEPAPASYIFCSSPVRRQLIVDQRIFRQFFISSDCMPVEVPIHAS